MVTVVQKLINDLKEANSNIEFTTNFIQLLENALNDEHQQIMDAFDEGVKYGNSSLQTFDYPASRYYHYTYKNKA